MKKNYCEFTVMCEKGHEAAIHLTETSSILSCCAHHLTQRPLKLFTVCCRFTLPYLKYKNVITFLVEHNSAQHSPEDYTEHYTVSRKRRVNTFHGRDSGRPHEQASWSDDMPSAAARIPELLPHTRSPRRHPVQQHINSPAAHVYFPGGGSCGASRHQIRAPFKLLTARRSIT